MPRKQVGAIDADLLAEVDKRAEWLGQTRRVFIERAVEQALSEAKEPLSSEQADPGVRSAAPAEQPERITEAELAAHRQERRKAMQRGEAEQPRGGFPVRVAAIRSSQSKRDVRPRPKGGK